MMVASSHCVLWISKRQRGLLSRQAARVLSHRSWHELMDGSDDVAKLHEKKRSEELVRHGLNIYFILCIYAWIFGPCSRRQCIKVGRLS